MSEFKVNFKVRPTSRVIKLGEKLPIKGKSVVNTLLKIAPLEDMTPEEAFAALNKVAAEGRRLCSEAESYFQEMKEHYENITTLMEERSKPETDDEEKRNIGLVLMQVFEAMTERRKKEFKNFDDEIEDVEDWEKQILSRDSGKEAYIELEKERNIFISKYMHHKSRLGLVTQQDVAELTGIDRRQISRIENGVKPQFKTIQKIAQAFSVSVEEFCEL